MKNLFLTLSVIGCSALSMHASLTEMVASIPCEGKQPVKTVLSSDVRAEFPRKALKAPAKAAALESIDQVTGEYEWNYYDLINSTTALGMVTISAGQTEGAVTINGLLQGTKPLDATVDLEAATITIAVPQYMGSDSDGDVNFYLKTFDPNTGQIHNGAAEGVTSLVGKISGNEISFPEEYIWCAGDQEQENLGWYFVTAENMWTNASSQDEGWTDYCTATFVDGWSVPAFGYDPEVYPWTVKIQQNDDNAFLYRVNNPYLATECPLPNQYLGKGNIVFDLTDPDFVGVVPKIVSGFTVQGTSFMYVNAEGMYMDEGMTPAEIKEYVGDLIDQWSYYNAEENKLYLYNLAVNYAGATDQMFTWQDQQGNPVDDLMKGYLEFDRPMVAGSSDGVEAVNADSENAAPEYFTIDGIRLDVPAKGLTIVRKGNTVSKILVK